MCGLGACTILAAWWVHLLPDARSTLAAYNTLLCATVLAVNVWVIGTLQVAVHTAFGAGYRTGVAATHASQSEPWPPDPQAPGKVLRLVPDEAQSVLEV